MSIRVALVTGGDNGEKEVSLKSADTFTRFLAPEKYSITTYYIPHDYEALIAEIVNYDIAIPVIHGIGGEDGSITALCEQHNVPYFFTDAHSHKLCIDKYTCGEVVRQGGFVTPLQWIIHQGEQNILLPQHNGKVFIKPVHGGSSVDSGVFTNISEGETLIKKITEYDDVLIQEYVTGREFTVSVEGDWDKNPHVLAISEIITGQSFFDYDAKYALKNTQEVTPAILDKNIENTIKTTALGIYKLCRISCLGRIDFIYDNIRNILYFLEINTIPGFTETSFFPQAIQYNGLSISQYLDKKIQSILTSYSV